jgi:hypothetical protein
MDRHARRYWQTAGSSAGRTEGRAARGRPQARSTEPCGVLTRDGGLRPCRFEVFGCHRRGGNAVEPCGFAQLRAYSDDG